MSKKKKEYDFDINVPEFDIEAEYAEEVEVETYFDEPVTAPETIEEVEVQLAPEEPEVPQKAAEPVKEVQVVEQVVKRPKHDYSVFDVVPEGENITAQDMKMRRIRAERPSWRRK